MGVIARAVVVLQVGSLLFIHEGRVFLRFFHILLYLATERKKTPSKEQGQEDDTLPHARTLSKRRHLLADRIGLNDLLNLDFAFSKEEFSGFIVVLKYDVMDALVKSGGVVLAVVVVNETKKKAIARFHKNGRRISGDVGTTLVKGGNRGANKA